MDYALHVHLSPPDGRARLSALECEGAHRLLREGLEQFLADDHAPPGGLEISVEPYVTHIDVRLPAGSLAAAESSFQRGVAHALERSRLLTDWHVTSCEVTLDPVLDEAFDEDEDDDTEVEHYSAYVTDGPAARLRAEAAKVTAFGPEFFGPDTDPDDAALVAGALVRSSELFIDILCEDLALLVRAGRRPVDVGQLYILSLLPPHYRHRYDLEFTRSFLAAAMKATDRLAAPEWTPPGSLAEALALSLIIESSEEAIRPLETVSFTEVRPLLATLRFRLLSNLDHETLYEVPEGHDGDPVFAHLRLSRGVRDWFAPRGGGTVHPYRQQPDAFAPHEHDAECAPPEDEVRRVLGEKVGIDPERLSDVLNLAAIGLADAMWTHGPVMRWFSQHRLTDGELLRTTMHTAHHVREALHGWRAELGLSRTAGTARLARLAPEAGRFVARIGCWLTDPERLLSTGETLGSLAGADHAEAVDHAAGVLGGFLRQVDDLGLARTLLTTAMQSGLTRYHWWGAPGWPEQVDRILALVGDPGRHEWGPDGRLTSGLPPRPSLLDSEVTRVALLHRPWTLGPEAAEWCARAAHLADPEFEA